MKFVPYVFKSLFRKKTRSFLTLGSILLPLFVICLMGTLLRTLERQPSGQGMFRLVTRHKVSLTNWIPEAYRARIQQLGGIEEMSVWCWFGGKYIDYSAKNQFARFGVEPEKLLKVFDEARIVEGSAADWFSDRAGAMVGTVLMKKYGWKLGQKVVLAGDIYPVTLELTIRAVYDADNASALRRSRAASGPSTSARRTAKPSHASRRRSTRSSRTRTRPRRRRPRRSSRTGSSRCSATSSSCSRASAPRSSS